MEVENRHNCCTMAREIDENLRHYLAHTLVTTAAIESRLVHPITGLRYPPWLVYGRLEKYAQDFLRAGAEPRFIALAGLRGVGKTTLLWQIAHYLNSAQHQDIYFFNVNTLINLGLDVHQALEAFQTHILKQRFSERTAPITLLFDEVHDDAQWSKSLKILFDEARSAFILCTGSSALLLQQTADLARRMRMEKFIRSILPSL